MTDKITETAAFQKKLFRWYERHHRTLPWRECVDPYKIWISEVMLQQTTVQTVLPYYAKWIKTFPRVKDLSQAPLQKILKAWQGLGYYQRAKNLHKASRIITATFKGRIPQEYEDLKKLPGFGPYITAAVLSLAFDKPFPVVDANVRRVLMRLKGARGEANPKNDKGTSRFSFSLLPSKKGWRF